MPTKAGDRLREFVLARGQDSEAWYAARAAAADVNRSIDALILAVGVSVATDFLAVRVASLRSATKAVKRQKMPGLPTATGRRPRYWQDDAILKKILRNPPRGTNGRPLSISAIARLERATNPRWVNTEIGSVRKHLTRLNHEARADDIRALSHLKGVNLLALMAEHASRKN